MARPVTLFSGQWADLTFDVLCEKAKSFGYDGVEIDCWGDHFEVDKALEDDNYIQGRWDILNKHDLQCYAISTHLVGQCVADSIIDERGSPMRRTIAQGTPILQPTDERRRTGSHYTPRSLTEPIVRHALEPAFERIGPDAKPEDVLALKVCDPAMGSGAFLVEACRMLAARLVKAWGKHDFNLRTTDYESVDLFQKSVKAST